MERRELQEKTYRNFGCNVLDNLGRSHFHVAREDKFVPWRSSKQYWNPILIKKEGNELIKGEQHKRKTDRQISSSMIWITWQKWAERRKKQTCVVFELFGRELVDDFKLELWGGILRELSLSPFSVCFLNGLRFLEGEGTEDILLTIERPFPADEPSNLMSKSE